MFSNKGKLEKTIISSLKHQKFWNMVEVLKHQKKRNGGSSFQVRKWVVNHIQNSTTLKLPASREMSYTEYM